VRKRVDEAEFRMLGYNGSIPGPALHVDQGSEITVEVTNDGDVDATVHWHGLRLENRYDGVPHDTQAPIPIGGTFTYKVQFPDAGFYWYHPHIREDFGLEMGLYGTIIVEPSDPSYWPAVDRQLTLTLDDLLVEDGHIAPFHRSGPNYTAMGRFGNVMLINGETEFAGQAAAGEVVRLFLVNTANTRIFNFAVRGARAKLVGGDSGRYERETWVDEVLLAPSERAVLDVLFDAPGEARLEHRTPDHVYDLGAFSVSGTSTGTASGSFADLRVDQELTGEHQSVQEDLTRPPDKVLAFVSSMPLLYGGDIQTSSYACPMHFEVTDSKPGTCPKCGMQLVPVQTESPEQSAYVCPMHPEVTDSKPGTCPKCGMKLVPMQAETTEPSSSYVCPMHPEVTDSKPGTCPKCGMKLVPSDAAPTEKDEVGSLHEHEVDGLEWEDLMPEINRASDPSNMFWKLIDRESGSENGAINWAFTVGDRVKIRLVNEMESDHPMHHPFHIHGAGRFLVLSRDAEPESNLVWKDTVLVRAGQEVDILLDVSNPGLWMAHCHIAEHAQSGMMFSFDVARADE
jgi:FtsP/CotA-like multicopper oxidase with cupredoxin domain